MYLSSFYFCLTNIKGGIFMSKHFIDGSTLFGVFGCAVGLLGVGYAIGTNSKLSKISERLNLAIDDIADGTEIDIPEEVVSKAVDQAVQTQAKRAVERATTETISSLKKDIRSEVRKAIDEEYENLKDSVLKEITASAAKIDANRVRRDVEEAAKEAALEKFDDNLDDILEKFNDNLTNTSKIYSSIREAITRGTDNGKEFVVRLN